MSLPPDPHDDDLADPSPVPEPSAPTGAATTPEAGAPAPPPTSPDLPLPPPPPPAPPDVSPDSAVPDLAASPSSAAAPSAPVTPVRPPTGSGKRRTGWVVGGVAAAIVLVAGVAVAIAAGGSDDTEVAVSDAAVSDDAVPDDAVSDDDLADDSADIDPGDAEVGGSPRVADQSPVEVTEQFFAAVAAGDCADLIALMTPESYGPGQTAEEAIDECETDAFGTAAVAAADFDDVELVSERGDEARVTVTMTVGNSVTDSELPLRRVDGEWKMHLVTSDVPGVD